MKHNFRILPLLVIGLCFFQNVFGQNDADNRKELRQLQTKAQKLRAVKSYRIKTTTEVFAEKGATLKYKNESVSEKLPPDRSRYTSTAVIDGKTKKLEAVEIGGKTYLKIDGGEWKLDESEPIYSSRPGFVSSIKLIEETNLNGQPVKVYEEKGGFAADDGDKTYTRRYWFTGEGELLKTESEETGGKTNEVTRSISIYEYDANIKIEAPIK